MNLKLTQNQFAGSSSFLPQKMAPGSVFLDVENTEIYIYDVACLPKKVKTSGFPTSIVGISGSMSEFNTQLLDGNFIYQSSIDSFSKLNSIVADRTIVNLEDGGSFLSSISAVPDSYNPNWSENNSIPTKRDIYTKIESINQILLNKNKTIEVLKSSDEVLGLDSIYLANGIDSGKKPFITPDSSSSITYMDLGDIGVDGDLINFSGNSLNPLAVLGIRPVSGISILNIPEGSTATVSNGQLAVARKINSLNWRLDGTFNSIQNPYSSFNIYTESSSINPDNFSTSLGSWVDQSSGTSTIQISNNAPSVINGSNESIRFYDNTPSLFERMVLPYSGLSTSSNYEIRFFWRRVKGGVEGLRIEATNS